MISSRLGLSTFAHLPDLSFCWFSQRWVPHHHYLTLQQQESSVTQVIQGCHLAIARGSLTPAEASTLRGQAGWTATLSAGRFGRIGMRFLKERQYQSPSARSSLDEQMFKR